MRSLNRNVGLLTGAIYTGFMLRRICWYELPVSTDSTWLVEIAKPHSHALVPRHMTKACAQGNLRNLALSRLYRVESSLLLHGPFPL